MQLLQRSAERSGGHEHFDVAQLRKENTRLLGEVEAARSARGSGASSAMHAEDMEQCRSALKDKNRELARRTGELAQAHVSLILGKKR